MTRPTMRRLASSVLALACLLALLAPSASAQEPLEVARLTLLSQTPWNSSAQRQLDLRFRATNPSGEPISDLSIGVTLYGRVITRTAYQQSLVTDPALVIDAETLAREGPVPAGGTRDFEVSFTLDSLGIDPSQSGVYPLKVDLRSGVTSIAAIRAPVIFLVTEPAQPLALSWTFVLDHPIAFGPDGVFTNTSLETSLAGGGRLAGTVRALLELAGRPAIDVDVAVSPMLLTQLGRMRDGYEIVDAGQPRQIPPEEDGAALAAGVLADLRTIAAAPNVRVTALPFSTPELPALLAGGLARDVTTQLERGREVVGGFLQTTVVSGILRPPGAALDEDTLRELASAGIVTLVVGPTTVVVPPQPLGFAGPPTAALGEIGELTGVVPEPGIDALLSNTAAVADPVLSAQAALGELATIWQERPGEVRGVSVVVSEDAELPGGFFVPFTRGVAGAPWLEPVSVAELVAAFPPADPTTIAAPATGRFGPTYIAELKQARRRVDTLRSMLPEESEEPERLERTLLLAESRQFLAQPGSGLAFITSVRDSAEGAFDAVELETAEMVTLTSDSGSGLPVTVTNRYQEPLRFSVRLVSQFLEDEPTLDVELDAGATETLTFQVDLARTGRFTVQVQVVSPSGRTIDQHELTVRSTVYNRIALFITIAAAFVLLVLWARRFVPRRTS